MFDNTLIAAEVVSAYIRNNAIPATELPDLVRAVVAAFDNLGKPSVVHVAAPKLVPAVSVKKSVHRDYLVSLEDGKRYKTLRRHLSALGMKPDQYRAKWGLAADYPMVARAYSEKRSTISKALGLGRKKTANPMEVLAVAKEAYSAPVPSVEQASPVDVSERVQDNAESVQEAA